MRALVFRFLPREVKEATRVPTCPLFLPPTVFLSKIRARIRSAIHVSPSLVRILPRDWATFFSSKRLQRVCIRRIRDIPQRYTYRLGSELSSRRASRAARTLCPEPFAARGLRYRRQRRRRRRRRRRCGGEGDDEGEDGDDGDDDDDNRLYPARPHRISNYIRRRRSPVCMTPLFSSLLLPARHVCVILARVYHTRATQLSHILPAYPH